MITILHGDDTEFSREQFRRLIESKKSKDVRHIDGRKTDATQLTQASGSDSLFGSEVVVVVENLFSTILKQQKKLELFVRALRQAPKDIDIVVWEQKELPATLLTKLGASVTPKLFKTPVVIFKFLDGFLPGQIKSCLELYNELSRVQAPEVIFLMMTRRIRQLMLLATGVKPEALASWQLSRLTTQARAFSVERLQTMYKQLLEIDYSIKSGQSPFLLDKHIELFLLRYL